jgi:integrase/recombinase XerC
MAKNQDSQKSSSSVIELSSVLESDEVLFEEASSLPATVRPANAFDGQKLATSQISTERLFSVMENYVLYYAAGDGHTARAKRYDLQHFIEFLAGSPEQIKNVLVSDWTLQATKDFVDERLSLGESPATVSRRLATIKHFGRSLAERIPGYINPAREAKGPTIQATKPHGLSAEEITLLRTAAEEELKSNQYSFQVTRNCFLLELLLSTGLRADEVRLLTMGQLSEDGAWLKNVKTKGKKFRNVYLDTDLREKFANYLQARHDELLLKVPLVLELKEKDRARLPVLISTYRIDISKPASFGLSPKSVWRIISDFGKKAQALSSSNVSSLHPHKLRHTFAHGLLDSSKDVRLVAQALGHSDVRTTMRYTERTEDEIAKAIEEKIGKEPTSS